MTGRRWLRKAWATFSRAVSLSTSIQELSSSRLRKRPPSDWILCTMFIAMFVLSTRKIRELYFGNNCSTLFRRTTFPGWYMKRLLLPPMRTSFGPGITPFLPWSHVPLLGVSSVSVDIIFCCSNQAKCSLRATLPST